MKNVKVTKDLTGQLMSAMKGIGAKRVLVGIPQQANNRKGDPLGNAAIGRIQETGSPAANIPARPFLVPGAAEASKAAPAILRAAAVEALGKMDASVVTKGLNRLGLQAQGIVKKRIVDQVGFQVLAAGTLAARKRKGFKGEKALIRTGELLNSIKYVIR